MTNLQRIKQYQEDIDGLKRILKTISYKDNDVREEIKEEIADIEKWIIKLTANN